MSVAETTAPRRRAVAIACSPATPAPMIEDLGRRHGARCGHQHRHHPVELGEAVDHRPIAGEVGLAGQHVHALGAGGARQQLQGERDHARLGVGRHLLRILVGIEHADQDLSRAQQGHLVERALARGKRPPHLEHDVRIAIDRRGHRPPAWRRHRRSSGRRSGRLRRPPPRSARRSRGRPAASPCREWPRRAPRLAGVPWGRLSSSFPALLRHASSDAVAAGGQT